MRHGLLAIALTLTMAGTAAAAPGIVAHRGGPLANGKPAFPENSLPALKNAAESGWVLEFDVSLTEDRVPVVIHDDRLDRTTNCSGLVKDIEAETLRKNCLIDVNGTTGVHEPLAPEDQVPVPTLAEVLEMAEPLGATITPEIKNVPPTTLAELTGSDDFDPDPGGFATAVSEALAESGYPQERIIVQSFWPANLDVAREHLPDAQLSLLTIKAMNDLGPEYATAFGYGWISPEFGTGLNPTYVERAHLEGRKVTTWTLNTAEAITRAAQQGVDAIITDDPVLAKKKLADPPAAALARGANRPARTAR